MLKEIFKELIAKVYQTNSCPFAKIDKFIAILAKNIAISAKIVFHMADFSANFRKLRQSSGHTQESMAFAMGVSTSVINRIESGKRKLNMEMIPQIAKASKKKEDEVLKELNSVIVHSSITENHGNGVNVENADLKAIRELYERLLAEKDKYIIMLESQLKNRN